MKQQRISKSATIASIVWIVTMVVLLGLLTWTALSAVLPSITNA
ncbi:hypothetical protein [Devosia sp. LjRoot3]